MRQNQYVIYLCYYNELTAVYYRCNVDVTAAVMSAMWSAAKTDSAKGTRVAEGLAAKLLVTYTHPFNSPFPEIPG